MIVTWKVWEEHGLKPWRIQQLVNGKPVWYPPQSTYTEIDAKAFITEWEKQHDNSGHSIPLARDKAQ
jgi:hypothetical protein